MLTIFAYAIGVMYTPGPINLLGLHSGVSGRLKETFGFFVGVGVAMLLLLLLFGWVGSRWVQGTGLMVISAVGALYILYLAVKIGGAGVNLDKSGLPGTALRFRDGLVMQLFNPKGTIATLPIAAIQFPAQGIHGVSLLMWSSVIAVMAIGAPSSYCLMGQLLGRRINNPRVFRYFNAVMALLLVYVALNIAYKHVLQPLIA